MVPLVAAVVYEVVARYLRRADGLVVRCHVHALRGHVHPSEWPAAILVFLPIFYPVVSELGVDLVWFGALVVSEPPPATSSSQSYGESYEQMYRRSLEAAQRERP